MLSNPKVLMEAFPLTIKKGTGIYSYAINLLEAINSLSSQEVGLLFLLEQKYRFSKNLTNPDVFLNLNAYTQLLYTLSYGSNTNKSKYGFISKVAKLQSKLKTYIYALLSLISRVKILELPLYFNPSFKEITVNNESIYYDFIQHNHSYITYPDRPSLLFRNLLDIGNQLDDPKLANYDVFHCTHLSPITIPKLPRVTTIHDIIPLLRPELVVSESSLAFAKLLKLNITNSTKIIAVSEATKSDLVNLCMVPPTKIRVVHEAAPKDFYPVSYDAAFPILDLLKLVDQPYFLFIGNIEPKKNIKRILLAFKEFSLRDRSRFKLVIVGDRAWGFDEVKSLITEMIAAGSLIITGYLPKHYLPALLSHARAFLFPSLIEGFGLPVLEAMACGCPVITSDIAAISEVSGDAAIQVNPLSSLAICEAIAQVANDHEICEKLRQKGLARNQLFSWEKCAKDTMAVYDEAIALFNSKV